jgi:hypothetical protein
MPPDPEMIQVGDAIWQGPQWRGLVQGAVRPVRVVEVLVLPQHHHHVARVPGQGPVQQLTPAAANSSLRDRIHSRCLNGGADDPDPGRLEHGIERLREAGVPVMQDEFRSCPGIPQVHEQVPGLLDDPGLDLRQYGGTSQPPLESADSVPTRGGIWPWAATRMLELYLVAVAQRAIWGYGVDPLGHVISP